MGFDIDYIVSLLRAAVLAGTPLLLGTLGEIIAEKVGNLNLGVEGMMYMGAVAGFAAGLYADNAGFALFCAFAAGALGALIYAFLTVTLKANQNVTGLTLTIFGTGLANYVGEHMVNSAEGGRAVLSDSLMARFAGANIPFLSSIPRLGPLLFQYNLFVYLALFCAIAAGVYLHHTRKGLNMRAVGENPAAADAAGISVSRYKYLHVMLGGGLCGLGGAYISIVTCSGVWTYNVVAGQGWIAVALVIFASWSPYRAIIGSLVFGLLSVLRLYTGSAVKIPTSIYSMLPFVVTAVVLAASSIRMSRDRRQPKGCGVNYFREER